MSHVKRFMPLAKPTRAGAMPNSAAVVASMPGGRPALGSAAGDPVKARSTAPLASRNSIFTSSAARAR